MSEIDWVTHQHAALDLANRVLNVQADTPAQAGLISSPGERCFAQFSRGEMAAFVRLVPSVLYDRNLRPVEALRVEDLLAMPSRESEFALLRLVSEVLLELESSFVPDVAFAYSDKRGRYRSFGFHPVIHEYHLRATGLRGNRAWSSRGGIAKVAPLDAGNVLARVDGWPGNLRPGREGRQGQAVRLQKLVSSSGVGAFSSFLVDGDRASGSSAAIGCIDVDKEGEEWLRVERFFAGSHVGAATLVNALIDFAGDRGMFMIGVGPEAPWLDVFHPDVALSFPRVPGALIRLKNPVRVLSRIFPEMILSRVVVHDDRFVSEQVLDSRGIHLTEMAIRRLVFSRCTLGQLVDSRVACCGDSKLVGELESVLDAPASIPVLEPACDLLRHERGTPTS